MGLALTRGTAQDDVRTAIDAIVRQEYDYASKPWIGVATDSFLFKQERATGDAVIVDLYRGPGYFQERGDMQDASQGTVSIGQQRTISILNLSRQIDISKNLFDDDKHGLVRRMLTDFGEKARLSRDRNAFKIYRLGFTTQLTNDAVSWFNNSHIRLDGGAADNLETGTLTPTNLETLVNGLMDQRQQDGTLGLHQPDVLLVPPALWREGNEIVESDLRSDTANNALNYISLRYPGLEIRVTPFINANNGGSDTAYFLLGRNHSATRFVRAEMETALVEWKYQRNLAYVYTSEFREEVAALSYEASIASNGTV